MDRPHKKEIETFLGVAHPTVVGLVSRMEQSVRTCWPCEDGAQECQADRAGRGSDKDMQRNRLESEQMLLSPPSPEERERCESFLITVAEHLA